MYSGCHSASVRQEPTGTLMTELGWSAVRVRDLTRGGHKEQGPGISQRVLHRSMQPVQFGPCEIGYGYVLLPSGLKMDYADPSQKWIPDENGSGRRYECSYGYGNSRHRLYGALLL